MLRLYTKPPTLFFTGCFQYYVKSFAKKILGRVRGPEAVLKSLIRGLTTIDFTEYTLNIPPQHGDTVHVLSNVEALKWAIKEKRKGIIEHIIAGPNLVIIPTEHNSLLADPAIDIILTTASWTKEFYASLLPTVANKIKIWPAGVAIPTEYSKKTGNQKCIIFKKNVDSFIYTEVINELRQKNILYTEFVYGTFNQQQYFSALLDSDFMIYLQEVESQGIALQEAWARNIPTLVWNKGSFTYPSGHTVHGAVSAPFLTPQIGMFFETAQEFPVKLQIFRDQLEQYSPRQYCIDHLSDKASALIYTTIIKSL